MSTAVAKRQAPSRTVLRVVRQAVLWPILLAGALVSLGPLIWMLSSAFKPSAAVMSYPPGLVSPGWPTLENFVAVWSVVSIPRAFGNSSFVSSAHTVGVLLVSAMMAYALSHLEWPGRDLSLNLILATMMIPFYLVMIPLFITVRTLGLFDNYGGLILPTLTSPFAIYLIRQYLLTIPRELCDSARIDGASEIGILFQIVLPVAKPALVVVAVTSFNSTWNDFLWPLIVVQSQALYTLPLTLIQFFQRGVSGDVPYWGAIMAVAFINVTPVLILFLFFQREFVAGLTAGALKR